jgi:hypothetical protein
MADFIEEIGHNFYGMAPHSGRKQNFLQPFDGYLNEKYRIASSGHWEERICN